MPSQIISFIFYILIYKLVLSCAKLMMKKRLELESYQCQPVLILWRMGGWVAGWLVGRLANCDYIAKPQLSWPWQKLDRQEQMVAWEYVQTWDVNVLIRCINLPTISFIGPFYAKYIQLGPEDVFTIYSLDGNVFSDKGGGGALWATAKHT